jgi:hypothetical protein
MEEEIIKNLFITHPAAKEVYRDANGSYWISKETAFAQSKGGKVTTFKRSEYIKTSKTEE